MFEPLVSIIIPVYNGANYLSEAIDSALAQTYKNIEIIVVNDGSNDDGATDMVANSYGHKIKYIKKANGGSSSALNTGIKNMSGDYFSWLSHDDLYVPQRVEHMLSKADPARKDQVLICSSSLIDSEGNPIFHPNQELTGTFPASHMFQKLRKGFGINGCSIMIPKQIISEVGLFDENLRYVNDYDYWYRLSMSGCEFVCFDEKLVKTRIHGAQVSVTSANLFKTENEYLAKKIFNKLMVAPEDNIQQILIYMETATLDGNNEIVKPVLKELKKKKLIANKAILKLKMLNLYGISKNMAKQIYKKVFFKR